MTNQTTPGGVFITSEGLEFNRMGYGAMQLAGPGVWGPPADRDEAIRVLRAAVDAGVNHIDTADFYGPHVVNEIIHTALAPYDGVTIATKVGSVRDAHGGWVHARSPQELREQVESNLRTLGVEALEVVNLRVGGGADGHTPVPGSIAEPFGALAELRDEGKIRHLGLSVVTAEQVAEAETIAPIITVQNWYNLVHRGDEQLMDDLDAQGVAYTAFWPLGGFHPLQLTVLDAAAAQLGVTPQAVALAWILGRSPNVLVIPGTSKLTHLRENLAAADLVLPTEVVERLDGLSTGE